MKTWLLKIVQGRYRCWDDFVRYGMVSAGHGNPPSAPLKRLSVGDEVYAWLDGRGYVGRGTVTQTAVLAGQFEIAGDFVLKDGSGRLDRVKLTEILGLGRADMCEDASDPKRGEWVVGIKWLSVGSRKKPKRFPGMQEPQDTIEQLSDVETEKFLASAFKT